MCELCRHSPCDPRCPNAPEPIPIHTCTLCNEGIYEGDRFYEAPTGPVCEDCIWDMNGEEFMKLIGEQYETAEGRDEFWDED